MGGVSGTSKGLVEELLREALVELSEEEGVVPGVWLPGGAGAFLCLVFCTSAKSQPILISTGELRTSKVC